MGRFTPQVSLRTGEMMDRAGDRLFDALDAAANRERQEMLDRERREMEDLELGLRGIYRGTAPENPEMAVQTDLERDYDAPEQGSLFQRPQPKPSPLSPYVKKEAPRVAPETDGDPLGLDAYMPDSEPEVAALPGQYVPGVGFTPKAIFTAPALPRMPPTRMQSSRYEQVTPGFYRDNTRTPEFQKAEAATLEQDRLMRAAREYGFDEGEAGLIALDPTLMDNLLEMRTTEDDMIEVRGRQFPNTPEGEAAAIRWAEQYRDATTRPPAGSTGRPTYNQAMENLKEFYAVRDEYGDVTGFSIPLAEMDRMAREMATSDGFDLPQPRGEYEPPAQERVGAFEQVFGRPPPTARELFTPRSQQPAGRQQQAQPVGVGDAEIESVRNELRAFPRERWEQILTEEGVSPADIRRIIGR